MPAKPHSSRQIQSPTIQTASKNSPKNSGGRSFLTGLKRVSELIDVISLSLSPVAIFAFIVFFIMVLDAFGSHVQFVTSMEQKGTVQMGIWKGISDDAVYGFVELSPGDGNGVLLIPLQYYSSGELSALKEGQPVKVRYAELPDYSVKGILENEFLQVKYYAGYLKDYFWPLFFCWGILVLHPDFLLLGLTQTPKKSPVEGEQV